MPATVGNQFVPSYVELVPEQLDLRVFRHSVETPDGPVACWSYVTDGLRRLGQKEIVFTLRRRPDDTDAFPQDPVDFVSHIFERAQNGQFIEAGGTIEFPRDGGFLGCDGPASFVMINATPLKGVNFPDKLLAAYLITSEELQAVQKVGPNRLLSLLGKRANVFPYPLWSERDRPTLLSAADLRQSLLGQLPQVRASGIFTRRHRGQVHIHAVDERALDRLDAAIKALPAPGAFVMITDPDPAAKGRLVWKPGTSVEAVTSDPRPDAMMTGSFFAMVPTRSGPEGAHICEDGFAVKLKATTWEKVRHALIAREPMTIHAEAPAVPLVIGLASETISVRRAGAHFYLDVGTLYSRIKPDEMTWFDRRVGNIVEDHFADLPAADGEALTVFCAIRPGNKARFWLECQPNPLNMAGSNLLIRRLAALKPPAVKGPVAWAVRFDLWGGTGDPRHFAHMPHEWTNGNGDCSHSPDQILDRAWPAK
ncbi:MAG: hypothetical protein ACJ8C4_10000 [Gemmataceae bacterium]